MVIAVQDSHVPANTVFRIHCARCSTRCYDSNSAQDFGWIELICETRNHWQNFFSRRRFLKMMGQGSACGTLASVAPILITAEARLENQLLPDFEEIPTSVSGIKWVHTAGLSPSMYLPETDGAGCAFLDYDNDGWMDIYLVNSGKCDF